MPRVATTSSTRAQNRVLPTCGKPAPSPPLKHRCTEPGCPWSFNRISDLNRHARRHVSGAERESQMIPCPACDRKFLQKSNMETHFVGQHTGLKPHFCTQCTYSSADPSSLHRHMCANHGYVPGMAPRKKRSAASELFEGFTSYPAAALSPASASASDSSSLASPSTSSVDDAPLEFYHYDHSSGASSSSAGSPSTSAVDDAPQFHHYDPSSGVFSSVASPSTSTGTFDDAASYHYDSSSPASSYHYDPSSSPASSLDSSLPASPTTPSDDWTWAWDPAFDPSFDPTCFTTPAIEPTPSPSPVLQAGVVPDQYRYSFDAEAAAAMDAASLLYQFQFFQPGPCDPAYPYILDFDFLDLDLPREPVPQVVFNTEWNGFVPAY
ncbi:hypothetical protein C8R46DRAFT_1262629 [Mycena filopes]|nr:hypothetical protein C8R46DRAFT_1262629 [Mycena filopes]